jgi:hypothetical protein
MLVKRVWTDPNDDASTDAGQGDVDVTVEMENGEMWTAHFVTVPYLRQQIDLSKTVADDQSELGSVGFVALETPHVIVEKLDQESIEDIVEDLMVLGTFEAVFDLVIDTPEDQANGVIEE